MRTPTPAFLLLTGLALAAPVLADGPLDNSAEKIRPVPPPGIVIPDDDRAALEAGIGDLGDRIASLRRSLKEKPGFLELLPDVEIYHKAVRYAVEGGEIFHEREIQIARDIIARGIERARLLGEGSAPWASATGLVVRAYTSRIDGSVQPFGLVVPGTYRPGSGLKHRLDVWFHGRGETLSELNFIHQRERAPGDFTPPGAFVLHAYGRYCNASKLAGEVDLFEAQRLHVPRIRRPEQCPPGAEAARLGHRGPARAAHSPEPRPHCRGGVLRGEMGASSRALTSGREGG